ncbi:MAG: hypothetical protein P4L82_22160 [Ancalomicrobiaceae bacterium]|nr:hypothetical protein [Ancalomicrobiaceae bacterium]
MSMLIARSLLALATALAPPTAAAADPTPPKCAEAASAATLPANLAAWPRRAPVATAAAPGGIDTADIALGAAVDAELLPAGSVTYAIHPEKPGVPTGSGGLLRLNLAEAGTYRVVLGARAWIDIVSAGQLVPSVGHAEGPACSGIRKLVDFTLVPGIYVLQLSGSDAAVAGLLVVKLP